MWLLKQPDGQADRHFSGQLGPPTAWLISEKINKRWGLGLTHRTLYD